MTVVIESILRNFNNIESLVKLAGQPEPGNDVYNTTSCLEKPYRCPHPKIKFFLYTRRTQELGEEINVLNVESLWNSHWNPVHPVKVIIHGEFDNKSSPRALVNFKHSQALVAVET